MAYYNDPSCSSGNGTPRRRNGLTRPFSTAQLSAGAAFVLSAVQYAVVCAPLLPKGAIAPITLLFVAAVGWVWHASLETMLIDTVDVHLCRHYHHSPVPHNDDEDDPNREGTAGNVTTNLILRNPLHRPPLPPGTPLLDRLYLRTNAARQALPVPPDNNNDHGDTNDTNADAMKQCWICDVPVAEHSMHCKFCNKCVDHFDHHCICTFFGTKRRAGCAFEKIYG